MLFNITYSSKRLTKEINSIIGRPYSFLQRIRMKGIGTSKMQLVEYSSNIADLLQESNTTHYCYLELRPKGLIVGFQSKLKTYVLLIPFYQLSIYYNGGLLSIFSNNTKMKMKAPFYGSVDKKFLKKVLMLKTEYLSKVNLKN